MRTPGGSDLYRRGWRRLDEGDVKPVQLGLSLLPVAVIVFALIGWVVTLRGNLDSALVSIRELQASQYDDTGLVERVQELSVANEEGRTKLAWIMEEYGPAIESIRDRELDTTAADHIAELGREIAAVVSVLDRAEALDEAVDTLEKEIVVLINEQRTINADHQGFQVILSELGKAGLIPSGERRQYGK